MENARFVAECLDCGAQTSYTPDLTGCPVCKSQWMEARYDYIKYARELVDLAKSRSFNLWRYREVLPVSRFNPDLFMGEGGTPLIRAANLGTMLGCPNLFIKDERQGPTASFKDRQAAVSIQALKEAGVTEMVLSSTGNVAISYSAYAARAGIKLWAFLTSLVPAEKMRETAIYGAQVIKVTATYDQAKQVAAEYARQRGLYLERGALSIPSVEGMKTIAYEIVEQLSDQQFELISNPPPVTAWTAPDWYFQSVSGGLGPLGVQKGFIELCQMGLIHRIPSIACIQAEGCAPMVAAWQCGMEKAEPVVSPRTHIATLATGDPGRTYTLLYQRMHTAYETTKAASGNGRETRERPAAGLFESVTDEETFRTMHILARLEGISVEPAAAVAFAGLIKLVRSGAIKPEEVIVVNCTGHTMPIELTILGNGWSKDVSVPETAAEAGASHHAQASSEQEGLLAALSRVTADRFSKVLIVDDTEEARRLIRRILQSQGDYSIVEAKNGLEAISMANQDPPDLIILDLMMPELDGFATLDRLKANPETASVPIIVVTAKSLTVEEKRRLEGRISSLMQKGEFMSDELLEEVQTLLQ